MRALLQRVERASVEVDGELGGRHRSRSADIRRRGAERTSPPPVRGRGAPRPKPRPWHTRSLTCASSPTSRVARICPCWTYSGSALVISQFTLYADTRRGRRPSFTDAADPAPAEALVEEFRLALEALGRAPPPRVASAPT